MIASWSIGALVGNAATHTTPPSADAASGARFLLVCAFNALLLTVLLRTTRRYCGPAKWISICLYLFMIQFGLTQMETWFFSASIGISPSQILSIVVGGLVMSVVTVRLGVWVHNRLYRNQEGVSMSFSIGNPKPLILPLLVLAVIVYPFIYLFFGYYIAWQNEDLRLFYAHSTSMNSFQTQLRDSFFSGIFYYQMLRGLIWIIVTIPVVLMLRHLKALQYVLIGIFSALFPASLLLIPNPYMPADIAMSHFYETATSNFLWGMMITFVVNTSATGIKLTEGQTA